MTKRKIIQIAATPMTDTERATFPPTVVALTDDGLVWESCYNFSKDAWEGWSQMPVIPQPKD